MVLGPNNLLHTLVQLYEPINLPSPSLHRSIRTCSFCRLGRCFVSWVTGVIANLLLYN
jgi:hypothetical protein